MTTASDILKALDMGPCNTMRLFARLGISGEKDGPETRKVIELLQRGRASGHIKMSKKSAPIMWSRGKK